MFFKKRFDDSVNAHKEETQILQDTVNEVKKAETAINSLRAECKDLIINIKQLVNSIANTPKSIDDEFDTINADLECITDIHNTDQYINQLQVSLKVSNALLTFGAGCLIFAGVSSIQKNEFIEDENALQETYEDTDLYDEKSSILISDSNDTNTSNESTDIEGIIKVGAFVIGGVSFGIGSAIRPISYYRKSNSIYSEITKIKEDCDNLRRYNTIIKETTTNTKNTYDTVNGLLDKLIYLNGTNYIDLSEDEKTRLWELVKYAVVISELLHRKPEVSSDE